LSRRRSGKQAGKDLARSSSHDLIASYTSGQYGIELFHDAGHAFATAPGNQKYRFLAFIM